jgi:hypothetical protein
MGGGESRTLDDIRPKHAFISQDNSIQQINFSDWFGFNQILIVPQKLNLSLLVKNISVGR